MTSQYKTLNTSKIFTDKSFFLPRLLSLLWLVSYVRQNNVLDYPVIRIHQSKCNIPKFTNLILIFTAMYWTAFGKLYRIRRVVEKGVSFILYLFLSTSLVPRLLSSVFGMTSHIGLPQERTKKGFSFRDFLLSFNHIPFSLNYKSSFFL